MDSVALAIEILAAGKERETVEGKYRVRTEIVEPGASWKGFNFR